MELNAEYPYYMDVNKSYNVTLSNDFNGSESLFLVIESEVYNLSYINESNNYVFGISSDVEEDLFFEILETSEFIEVHSGGDGNPDGELIINEDNPDVNNFFVFSSIYNKTTSELESHTSTVCAQLGNEKSDKQRSVVFVSGVYNESGYTYFESDAHLVDTETVSTHCGQVFFPPHTHPDNINITSGFYCIDCDDKEGLILGTDNNATFSGRSSIYNVSTDTLIQSETNYEILMLLDLDIYNSQQFNGVFRFREPYDITLNLYQENASGTGLTTQYCNELSTIFLVNESDKKEFEGLNEVTTLFNRFMNSLPFFGDHTKLNTNFVSENVVFYTSPYNDCSATVRLYEPGNYSVFLVGSKYVITDEEYGFLNPLTGQDEFISNIVDLEFAEKENKTISIFTSDWEISKIWVVLNIGKWVLFTIVPLVLIWVVKSGVLGALVVRLVSK